MANTYTKVTREQIASYLKTDADWSLIGVGVTEYGISYNPQVTTEKWIINKNATSSLDSYQVQGDVSQTCYYGDAVYDFVNELRRKAGVGSEAESEILDIDIYDATDESGTKKYAATKYSCVVAVTSYASGDTPAIEYSIYYNGDPEVGTVTIADGKPTFVKNA